MSIFAVLCLHLAFTNTMGNIRK